MRLLLLPLVAAQFYPLTRKGEVPELVPYGAGQELFIDCILRNIDNGEHKFDLNLRIVYLAFPTCKETGKPLLFAFGESGTVNCTITFSDELYHLFQLYIHEDAPFSCRVPLSSEAHYLELGGAYVPLTFNFRGEIHDSHLDIDPHMNVLFMTPKNLGTVVSAVAWGSGTNATRVIIGDSLTVQLATRWLHLPHRGAPGLPFAPGFYRLPLLGVSASVVWALALMLAAFMATLAWVTRGKRRYDYEAAKAD